MVFMAEKHEEYICKFFQDQSSIYKMYLSAALDNQEQNLCYLDQSLGTNLPSIDIKNCELLLDAKLFREETKVTRDGRNKCRLFFLTSLGLEMAQQIKEDSMSRGNT
jgi:hypothetical protein